jgi:hypothetical protein
MTTTSIREAIRERLDPVIEEIVSREIGERGAGYQQYGQQQQHPLASVLPFLLMSSQQQPGQGQQQQNPLASILPILLMSQQQQPGFGQQQQQPFAALAPVLVAALSQR